MAGEWLKFESSLPDKPETLAITSALGWDDPDLTVGKLMRLFRWFDQQTINGNARGVTPVLLDRVIGVTGFVQALVNVGWIVVSDAGLTLNNFDRHNGSTAKNRALTAKRVALHRGNTRDGDGVPTNAKDGNASIVTPALAREEKRREEREKGANALSIPGVPDPLLRDYLEVRKGKRAGKLTPTAIKGLEREAKVAGITLAEAIEACCEFGWQGFNAEWYADRKKSNRGGADPYGLKGAL